MRPMKRIVEFGRLFAAAGRVNADLEVRRRPRAADLRALGIDPARFNMPF
ncbi:hypothetical protein [Consotaella aegiceratis]